MILCVSFQFGPRADPSVTARAGKRTGAWRCYGQVPDSIKDAFLAKARPEWDLRQASKYAVTLDPAVNRSPAGGALWPGMTEIAPSSV